MRADLDYSETTVLELGERTVLDLMFENDIAPITRRLKTVTDRAAAAKRAELDATIARIRRNRSSNGHARRAS